MPRDQSKERKLLESVFASLRPPDPVARPRTAQEDPATVGRSRARALAPPALDITTLLSTPDFADCIAEHVVSRSTVCALARTSRALRAAVDASASLSCLGLFRTPYGRQHGTMLFPHQRRSLAHLRAAESPAGWKFGDVRGGILADDPGLGKTVTALALVVSTAGTPPATPQEFWDATGTGWEELCSNVAARRQLIPMLNALTSELETIVAHHRPLAHLDFVERMTPLYTFAQAVDTAGAFPTLDSFGGALHSIARDAAARLTAPGLTTAQATARLLEPVRVGLNRMRGALDKRRRAWFSSAVGRRAVFERCLVPAASTLVVVPAALLEHWYEQVSHTAGAGGENGVDGEVQARLRLSQTGRGALGLARPPAPTQSPPLGIPRADPAPHRSSRHRSRGRPLPRRRPVYSGRRRPFYSGRPLCCGGRRVCIGSGWLVAGPRGSVDRRSGRHGLGGSRVPPSCCGAWLAAGGPVHPFELLHRADHLRALREGGGARRAGWGGVLVPPVPAHASAVAPPAGRRRTRDWRR